MALAVVAIVVEMESGMSGSSSASGSSFRYGPVVTTVTMTVLGFSILAFRCLSCFHCSRYDGDSVPVKPKETDATACLHREVGEGNDGAKYPLATLLQRRVNKKRFDRMRAAGM